MLHSLLSISVLDIRFSEVFSLKYTLHIKPFYSSMRLLFPFPFSRPSLFFQCSALFHPLLSTPSCSLSLYLLPSDCPLLPSATSLTVCPPNPLYQHVSFYLSPHLGVVATIKEHITKPTTMAQGRVAHLIEWKGWGGGGQGGGGVGKWTCGGVSAELQEDEQFYSQMTDEIKEARFAAGENTRGNQSEEK